MRYCKCVIFYLQKVFHQNLRGSRGPAVLVRDAGREVVAVALDHDEALVRAGDAEGLDLTTHREWVRDQKSNASRLQ